MLFISHLTLIVMQFDTFLQEKVFSPYFVKNFYVLTLQGLCVLICQKSRKQNSLF